VIGSVVATIADALVDDTLYAMITDLQIQERPRKGEIIVQGQQANIRQGSSTGMYQNVSGGKATWKTYRTRVLSTANKVNLDFAEAEPILEKDLARSIAGILIE